jgi:hypothetical protein
LHLLPLAGVTVYRIGRDEVSGLLRCGIPARLLGVAMKLRMDKSLQFWIDVAYQDLKDDHANFTKHQRVASTPVRRGLHVIWVGFAQNEEIKTCKIETVGWFDNG